MALTIDGSHAIAANPNLNEVDDVYITAPRLVVASDCFIRVAKAVPIELFPDPQDKQRLINRATNVRDFLVQAEQAPDEAARQAALTSADSELTAAIKKFDGCFGGNATNDYLSDCSEQQNLMEVATNLQTPLQQQIVEVGCPPFK